MEMEDTMTPNEHLTEALKSHAPNLVAKHIVDMVVQMAIEHGASKTEIHLMLARMIVDGLAHGNWPWTSNEVFGRATQF